MVNVTFSPEGNPLYTQPDGTATLFNLGDSAWIITATARKSMGGWVEFASSRPKW
jgi:hypothetical protein